MLPLLLIYLNEGERLKDELVLGDGWIDGWKDQYTQQDRKCLLKIFPNTCFILFNLYGLLTAVIC